MKRSFFVACLMAVSVALQAKAYSYQTVEGDPMQTRIYTLGNGLKVYLSANPEKPRIQTFIAVRTGSKNDPAQTTGLAHYLEHLMFKGTKRFGTNNPEAEATLLADIEQRYEEYRLITDPETRRQKYHEIDSVSQLAAQYFIPNEYDKLMATIGAEGTNAYTSNDVTCYTEDIPANELENWAKIQSDRFQNMVIRGFHTELEAVYEEYNIGLSNDQRKLFTALMAMLFPSHPYGTQTTIGTQEHLKNPSITNIKNYFSHWYVPNNVAICMSGDLDYDTTIATIDRYFAAWKPGKDVKQPTFSKLTPMVAPRDTTVIGPQAATIWMGWRGKAANSLSNDTLDVISEILSNGDAGLFDLDLNQQMKVLNCWAGNETLRDYSFFVLGGTPKEGQSLKEVRSLMLEEIEKLKRGEFPDDMLSAIINNMKLRFYRSLDNNNSRANKFVEAFINEQEWKDVVERIDRLSRISKPEIVAFANRYFNNGYVTVFKEQGEDTTQKKIDKPAITPIPTNRDQVSQFVKDIQSTKVTPIQPRFLDFKQDLTITSTKRKLPFVYKQNTTDGLFNLVYHYEFGQSADNRYDIVAGLIQYLGTKKLSPSDIKKKFYALACSYNMSVGEESINISLSGLSESMPKALALLEDLLKNATIEEESYNDYVSLLLKARDDAKKDQRTNFNVLYEYGIHGPHNAYRDAQTEQQLKSTSTQVYLNLLKQLSTFDHTLLYYGPMSEKEVSKIVSKLHKTTKKLQAIPTSNPYVEQKTSTNEILLAPYDAPNIYMRMYHNELRPWDINKQATISVFNEYFGGGMNGIVFQELREARGLAYNAFAIYQRPSKKAETERYFTHIITQNDKMMDCLHQFQAILDTLPQSEAAFRIAKDALSKKIAAQRTTKFGVINAYLSAKRLGIDYDLNKKVYEQLPSLSLSDIVKFEQQQMARKPYRYIILGNEKELDMESLGKIGTIRRLSTEEIFGY